MRPRRGDVETGDSEMWGLGDGGTGRKRYVARLFSSTRIVPPSPRLPVIAFLRAWRGTILGALVVLSGVSAAVITVVARRSGDWELTRLGAIASLLFAVLIVRPPRVGARLDVRRNLRRVATLPKQVPLTAAAVGFADQAHMTRTFRQTVGYTPGSLSHT